MTSSAETVDDYIRGLPDGKREIFEAVREVIKENLPGGFEERMQYGMPSFVVPHALFPDGYHVRPEEPLPFISLASQKNYLAVYHMGLYAHKELLDWFTGEYSLRCSSRLDMGKSCIRFRKKDDIPLSLLGELAGRMTVGQWIDTYRLSMKK